MDILTYALLHQFVLRNKLSSQLSYTIFYKSKFDTLFNSSQFSIRLNQLFFK